MEFLRNVWYVAGHAGELDSTPLVSRRICNELIVFYRRSDGVAAALEDRCPHRFVPLSMGKREGDELRCGYHGLKFNSAGACVHVPAAPDSDLSRIRVKTYPIVERYALIWVWMGDPVKADPKTIPEFTFVSDPEFENARGYLHVKCNYELITDNLLDLSHVPVLHPQIGYDGDFNSWENTLEQKGNTVWSMLWRKNFKPPPFQKKMLGTTSERADGQAHVRWDAPANLLALTALNEVGLPPDQGASLPSAHLLTPETSTSTHYFWVSGRNRFQEDKELSKMFQAMVGNIFATQDGPMIQAQQDAMGEDTDYLAHKPIILKPDTSGVRARRVLKRLIHEEQEAKNPLAMAR